MILLLRAADTPIALFREPRLVERERDHLVEQNTLRFEEGRPKAVRDKVAGKGQQQYYWTEAVQVTNTDDRPDLSSEGAPDIDKTVNVKQKLISGHEPQMGLDTKTD
jgi:hypothetical protein